MVATIKKFSWIEWILLIAVGLVILIPKFDFIDVSGTSTSIRVEDFALAIVYLTWAGWLIKNHSWPKINRVHILMLVFLLAGVLSTSFGIASGTVENPQLGALNILRRVEYFLIFWAAYSWLKVGNLHRYALYLAAVTAVVVFVGVMQYFAVLPMYSTWEGYNGLSLYYGENFDHIIATFAGHYELGGYLLIVVPVIASLLFNYKQRRLQLLCLLLLLGCYLLLYFSYSRAAYVAMMGQALVLLILYRKVILTVFPIMEIGRVMYMYFTGQYSKYEYDIGVVKIPPSPQATGTATASATESATSSANASNALQISSDTAITLDPGGTIRIDIWKNALDHFKQSPLLGVGYSGIGTGADNQYLRTLAETGLVGLSIFVSILGYIIYRLFTVSQHASGYTKLFILSGVAIISGLMSQSLLIDIFDSSKVAILFWFVMALAIKAAEEVRA